VASEASTAHRTIMLTEYDAAVRETDILPKDDNKPVLMGLYGEVGGIMSTAKKHVREENAYPGFRRAAIEEFGDTLWYLAAYCRRLQIGLDSIFRAAIVGESFLTECGASDLTSGAISLISVPASSVPIDDALFRLGVSAASLLDSGSDATQVKSKLTLFAQSYLSALHASGLSFSEVCRTNITKTRGAFIVPNSSELPRFDDGFEEDERIPSNFRIRISQRPSGRSYLRWNDVFIGDPLTDNIGDPDGYRFHDVFHFAHAAILNWSPVLRSLIKQKRKSKAHFDEVEDGGRATVVEEGLTAWIFARAKELNYFEGQQRISYGVLKTIQEFTAGYEVSKCPPKLWERAILDGYSTFRSVRDAQGGWVVGDREARTIRYEPL